MDRVWLLFNGAQSSWTRIRIVNAVFGCPASLKRSFTATDIALEMGSRINPVRRETIRPWSMEARHVLPISIVEREKETRGDPECFESSLIPVMPVREEVSYFSGGDFAGLCAKHDSTPEHSEEVSSTQKQSNEDRKTNLGDVLFCDEESERCTRGEMEGYRYIPGTGYRWV